FVLLCPSALFSQSALKIKSTGVPFYLAVNQVLLSNQAQNAYAIYGQGEKNLQIVAITDSLDARGERIIEIQKGKLFNYDLQVLGKQIQLFEATKTNLDSSYQLTKNLYRLDSLINDSLRSAFLDSIQQEHFKRSYGSNTGCRPPLSKTDFTAALKKLNEQYFTKERLEESVRLLNSSCLWVDQVNQIFLLFDFDEQKLALIEHLEKGVFDLYNAEELKPKLIQEKSKQYFEDIRERLVNR
ncbi:MAG: DUF4476 domain-containing protein, partial [Luteibaculum sp.]